MRIYLVETKTSGKVKLSFEVGEIHEIYKHTQSGGDDDESYIIFGDFNSFVEDTEEYDNIINQGYTDQKYAIEINDVKNEDLMIEHFGVWGKGSLVCRVPQSFQYVFCGFYNRDEKKAILMPIHAKWADMILLGEKKYEFRNVIPKALR